MDGYRHIRPIARGGMADVELAVREKGNFVRFYAVKRLRGTFVDDPDMRAMFVEEARIAGLLRHPNVVAVQDVGEDETGPYLVMDFVEGVSLAQLLTRVRERGELVPIPICLRILRDIASGLHAAHELRAPDGRALGLVHRDVSLQNVLIGYDGVTRLTDFGIAKAAGRTAETSVGLLKGKIGYLSPEQLRFEEIDRRSDLFALGIVLYEIVTSQRLYAGRDLTVVARSILTDDAPDLFDQRNDAPPELVDLCFRLLAKKREARPATAAEVVARLDEMLHVEVQASEAMTLAPYVEQLFSAEHRALGEDLGNLRVEATELRSRVRLQSRRRRIGVAVALVFGLAAVGVGLATVWPGGPANDAVTEAPQPAPQAAASASAAAATEFDEPAAEEELDVGSAAPAATEEPAVSSRTSRGRRRGSRRTMRAEGGMDPFWGWE